MHYILLYFISPITLTIMKTIFLALLFFCSLSTSHAQLEFGVEIGHQGCTYFPTTLRTLHYTPLHHFGLKAGFFLEQPILPALAIRFNFNYEFRYFLPNKSYHLATAYTDIHGFSLPVKAIFKAGKIVHFGLGLEGLLITGKNAPQAKTHIHIGLGAEMAFRIRKKMRLSFYLNYDPIPLQFDQYPPMTNFCGGVSFAFIFKQFKKRRVIYSPG